MSGMKIAVFALTMALAMTLSSPGIGQQASGGLEGKWTLTDVNGRSWNGVGQSMDDLSHAELEFTGHGGGVFFGKVRWGLTSDEHQLDDGKSGVAQTFDEDLLAVEDFDGTYVVVEHPDTTLRRMKLVDNDTIQEVYYETGPGAVAGRATWKRQ